MDELIFYLHLICVFTFMWEEFLFQHLRLHFWFNKINFYAIWNKILKFDVPFLEKRLQRCRDICSANCHLFASQYLCLWLLARIWICFGHRQIYSSSSFDIFYLNCNDRWQSSTPGFWVLQFRRSKRCFSVLSWKWCFSILGSITKRSLYRRCTWIPTYSSWWSGKAQKNHAKSFQSGNLQIITFLHSWWIIRWYFAKSQWSCTTPGNCR